MADSADWAKPCLVTAFLRLVVLKDDSSTAVPVTVFAELLAGDGSCRLVIGSVRSSFDIFHYFPIRALTKNIRCLLSALLDCAGIGYSLV
jgi:hypothetical protein